MLTLVAGGALAQALPLLLGPLLSRLYTPQQFGQYNLFAAVSANIAVVACARYEFALPLLGEAREAAALRALCLRVLAVVTLASAGGAAAWFWWSSHGWTAWLSVAVVACARYEFALPLLGDAREAAALRALCLRVLAVVTLASAIGATISPCTPAPSSAAPACASDAPPYCTTRAAASAR